LTLPYATYQANSYDAANDIYVFANIRFAAAPTGTLRWSAPAPPPIQTGIQNGSYGGTCCQPTQDSGIGAQASGYEGLEFQDTKRGETQQKKVFFHVRRILLMVAYLASSESSLAISIARGLPFSRCVRTWCCPQRNSPEPLSSSVLDIWRGLWLLPVRNAITIVHGSKDEYSGTSLISMSNNSIIYVQTNYRVGKVI
jgi:Carboxylesterase family